MQFKIKTYEVRIYNQSGFDHIDIYDNDNNLIVELKSIKNLPTDLNELKRKITDLLMVWRFKRNEE